MKLSGKKSSIKVQNPEALGRQALSKSLIPEKEMLSGASSQNDSSIRSNKSANITAFGSKKRKKFSYLTYAEKRAEREQQGREKTPKKGSLYLEILAKKKANKRKKGSAQRNGEQRSGLFKKEKQERAFYYEETETLENKAETNQLSKSQVEMKRRERDQGEDRLAKTEVIEVKVDFEERREPSRPQEARVEGGSEKGRNKAESEPERADAGQEEPPRKKEDKGAEVETGPKSELGESGNLIAKLKTQIQKESQSNLLGELENEQIIKDALELSAQDNFKAPKVGEARPAKRNRKPRKKTHLNPKKISSQIEEALNFDPSKKVESKIKAVKREAKGAKKKQKEAEDKARVSQSKKRRNQQLAQSVGSGQNAEGRDSGQKAATRAMAERREAPQERRPERGESGKGRAMHDLQIEQRIAERPETRLGTKSQHSAKEVPKTKGRMTLREIRLAYKSKKEKRDKSHNRADLIKETIKDSKLQTMSEREAIPLLSQSEIQVDTQGNYIVPKRLFEKISQTQKHLMKNLMPAEAAPEEGVNWKSCSKQTLQNAEKWLTYSEVQNQVESGVVSPRTGASSRVDNREREQRVPRPRASEENPEDPFEPKRTAPDRVEPPIIPRKIDFQRKTKPRAPPRRTEPEETFEEQAQRERDTFEQRPAGGPPKEEMFGSQPIVMNNNFVNYNYYINDIRQSTFGSQTQKVPARRKPPGRAGNARKNQRVRSEANKARTTGKRGEAGELSDQEKLKYFEKYNRKYGVNYKAEQQRQRNNRSIGGAHMVDKRTRRSQKGSDLRYSEVDRAKNQIVSERDKRRTETQTTGKVKSMRRNTNRKKGNQDFIKRNMKLIQEAKKKAEGRMSKAMKTGEFHHEGSRAKQPKIEHKKSKSQIVSRRSEKKTKVGFKRKQTVQGKAVIKGKVDMDVLRRRMEREKGKRKAEQKERREVKQTPGRAFLSRSPISKKVIEPNPAFKTMDTAIDKSELKKKSAKRRYGLGGAKNKARQEAAKRRAEDKQRERHRREKRERKEPPKLGSGLSRHTGEYKARGGKGTRRGLNKSGMLPKQRVVRKERGLPKSYDPFAGETSRKEKDKDKDKGGVLFSELRGRNEPEKRKTPLEKEASREKTRESVAKFGMRKRFESTKKDAKEEKKENDKFLQAIADVEMNLKNMETQKPEDKGKRKEQRMFKSGARRKKAKTETVRTRSKREFRSKKEAVKDAPKEAPREAAKEGEKERVRTQGYNFYKRKGPERATQGNRKRRTRSR